jgi:hypothetical protein
MKGLSILITVVLLVLAHQLAVRLREAGALPAEHEAAVGVAAYGPAGAAAPENTRTLEGLQEM